jgi:transposase
LNSEIKTLATAIRQHRDLAERLDLIVSVDGVGLRTAVAILVRMPEIGRVTREHAASLAGLAPFDDDSADRIGARHIRDGRARLRASLYAAALPAAFRWNHRLMALYRRLTAAGKPHKVALIACARKLLIFANTVVERGTPWVAEQPIPSNLACTPRHAT